MGEQRANSEPSPQRTAEPARSSFTTSEDEVDDNEFLPHWCEWLVLGKVAWCQMWKELLTTGFAHMGHTMGHLGSLLGSCFLFCYEWAFGIHDPALPLTILCGKTARHCVLILILFDNLGQKCPTYKALFDAWPDLHARCLALCMPSLGSLPLSWKILKGDGLRRRESVFVRSTVCSMGQKCLMLVSCFWRYGIIDQHWNNPQWRFGHQEWCGWPCCWWQFTSGAGRACNVFDYAFGN